MLLFLLHPKTAAWLRQQHQRPTLLGMTSSPTVHHTSLKTRNITVAMKFYSLLGFEVESKFRAGPAKAAYLQTSTGTRMELIEVPPYMMEDKPPQKALDLIPRPTWLGWNHMSLDVTPAMKNGTMLQDWMNDLNQTSFQNFGKTIRLAVPPKQTIAGNKVYEMAMIYDADGSLIELVRLQAVLEQTVDSGWEPSRKVNLSLEEYRNVDNSVGG